MPQPIAGVAPSQLSEVTVMTVWPSLSATAFGRFWGRLYNIQFGFPVFGVPLTLGRLFALVSIPFMVALYFLMRLPRFPGVVVGIKNPWCWQYRLTNRRVIVENPFGSGESKSISLDRFNAIDVVVEPGQAWYKAGDLVFRQGQTETFRIWAVPRPETFRHTCLKAQLSFAGVKQARAMGAAV
jgi:hypothetical protein